MDVIIISTNDDQKILQLLRIDFQRKQVRATNSLNSGNPKSKSNQLIQSNIFEKTLN